MKIIINPKEYSDQYLFNLNKCFNCWGDKNNYDWVFNRDLDEYQSDIILINNENNQPLAGSAITYRKIVNDAGIEQQIGIMTGSWTLPEARGKGCFTKMIEVSKKVCLEKNVHHLTAFVVQTNPSYRRLQNAGSILIPTSHYISNSSVSLTYGKINILLKDSKNQEMIYERYNKLHSTIPRFKYTFEEFIKQYINRLSKTELIKINKDFAIIEETETIVKILLVTYENMSSCRDNILDIISWVKSNMSKETLFYSSKKELDKFFKNYKFEYIPGFFTVLNTSVQNDFIFEGININMGDKM